MQWRNQDYEIGRELSSAATSGGEHRTVVLTTIRVRRMLIVYKAPTAEHVSFPRKLLPFY